MAIDHLSLCTTLITLRKGDKLISTGTGFFFLRGEGNDKVLFLVTNYHVLTGCSPEEKEKPKGDNIEWFFHTDKDDSSKIRKVKLPLFNNAGKPIWLRSEVCPQADLAVIPIPNILAQNCDIKVVSEEWYTEPDLKVVPTTPAILIGYPYGFYDQINALPIWKTGSIASEPDVDFKDNPYFLLDISAFPGMSGSPAFAISHGSYESTTGALKSGSIKKFLGVYSSMQMLNKKMYLEELAHSDTNLGVVDRQSLELGHVWKASLVVDLINSLDIDKYNSDILSNIDVNVPVSNLDCLSFNKKNVPNRLEKCSCGSGKRYRDCHGKL